MKDSCSSTLWLRIVRTISELFQICVLMKSNLDYVSSSGSSLLGSTPPCGTKTIISNILERQTQCPSVFSGTWQEGIYSPRGSTWNICAHSWSGNFHFFRKGLDMVSSDEHHDVSVGTHSLIFY